MTSLWFLNSSGKLTSKYIKSREIANSIQRHVISVGILALVRMDIKETFLW